MKTPPKSYCVAFNGPPGIGKDTIAAILVKEWKGVYAGTLSELIRRMAGAHYKYEGFLDRWCDREWKEAFCPVLGMTRRQAIIHFSENIIKPWHGADYFAERFATEMKEHPASVMTDLGFDNEAHCLADVIDYVLVVQLHHPDFDFSKDSRNYVDIERENVVTIRHDMTRGNPNVDAEAIAGKLLMAFEARYR